VGKKRNQCTLVGGRGGVVKKKIKFRSVSSTPTNISPNFISPCLTPPCNLLKCTQLLDEPRRSSPRIKAFIKIYYYNNNNNIIFGENDNLTFRVSLSYSPFDLILTTFCCTLRIPLLSLYLHQSFLQSPVSTNKDLILETHLLFSLLL
jgi:hypothetical protein